MSSDAWWDVGLVLAAGAGRRYGQPKACVQLNGERLVDRAVRVLREGGCQDVLVVLGAWIGGVASAHTTHNPHWRDGMGSSLRWGLEQLQRQPERRPQPPMRAVISLVDLPGLTGAAVARLRRESHALVAASYQGQQGHPVLIGAHHWPALIEQLQGDVGARRFLRDQHVRLIPLDQLADGRDLDTPMALPASSGIPSLQPW